MSKGFMHLFHVVFTLIFEGRDIVFPICYKENEIFYMMRNKVNKKINFTPSDWCQG